MQGFAHVLTDLSRANRQVYRARIVGVRVRATVGLGLGLGLEPELGERLRSADADRPMV